MISPQWLELPMSRINFHGPKDVRAIEVLPYYFIDNDCADWYMYLATTASKVVLFDYIALYDIICLHCIVWQTFSLAVIGLETVNLIG